MHQTWPRPVVSDGFSVGMPSFLLILFSGRKHASIPGSALYSGGCFGGRTGKTRSAQPGERRALSSQRSRVIDIHGIVKLGIRFIISSLL